MEAPMNDSFEEQERSIARIEELGRKLAKDAARQLASHPDWKPAGLVLEQGTSEFKSLRNLLAHTCGQELAGPWIAGLATLDAVRQVLAANAGPDAVRWLDENEAAFEGRLLVVVAAKFGFRFGAVPLPTEGA
jgi:hypothetical protein